MTTAPSDKQPGTCPTCGAENAPGSRFCERCGTRLPPSSREAAGPTPGTPADATLTFERPLVGQPREEQDQPSASTDQPAARDEAVMPSPEKGGDEQAILRDAPTMNFDLPTLPEPDRNESRDAATLSFDLPEWAQHEKAEGSTAPSIARDSPPVAPAPAESAASVESETTGGRSWDYQPWRPQIPAEQTAPLPATEQGGTRPAIALPPAEAIATPSSPSVGASSAPPPQALPASQAAPPPGGYEQSLPATGQYGVGTQAVPPTQGVYTYPTPGQAAQPASQLPPTAGAGAPPAYGYPQGGSTGWSPSGASAYPAPATGKNNRTLWIILGVVGGLLILCAMICVLIFLVGVASASSTGAIATGVATTTRP